MNYLGRIVAGFTMIVLVTVFPLQYLAQSNNDTIDAYVEEKTQAFADAIRKKGCLDIPMYEDFINFLDATGDLYDVEIEDIHPVTGEDLSHANSERHGLICTDSSHRQNAEKSLYPSDRKAENPMAVSMKYAVPLDDKAVSNQIYNGSKEAQIKSFAAHTHTNDCYNGIPHICDGVNCDYDKKPVLVGKRGGYLYYSYDSINWINTNVNLGNTVTSITYGNGKFVATTENGVYTSTDGIQWSFYSLASLITGGFSYIYLNPIKYLGGYFIARAQYKTSYGTYEYRILYSKDGINWRTSSISFSSDISVTNILYTNGYYYISFVVGGTSGYRIGYMDNDGTLCSYEGPMGYVVDKTISQAGEYVISQGTSGNAEYIHYGLNITSADYRVPSRVLFANGTYYGFRSNGSGLGLYSISSFRPYSETYYSNTGLPYIDEYIYFGDRFVIYGTDSSSYSYIKTSVDGRTWSSSSTIYQSIACNANGGSGEIDRICKKAGKYYNTGGVEVLPICDRVVTSITATNPTQTVNLGGSIITTAIATYLDGHTGVVSCTSNFNPNKTGLQTVTLTYTGLVGNARTTGTTTCLVTVNVQGSIPISLSVTPSSSTVYNGTTPSYTVVVTYQDGTAKTLTTSQYTMTGWSSGPGTKSLTFSYTENGKTVTASVMITVLPNVSSLTVMPSSTTVYNGTTPTYTVVVNYENGTTKTLTAGQYTMTGWSSGPGTKSLTFSYTENSKKVTASVTITVLPNVSSLTVTPSSTTVYNGTAPTYTVVVNHEDGSSKTLTAGQYTMTGWSSGYGTKSLTFSYTENGVTITAGVTITVKPNLTSITVTPSSQTIMRYTDPVYQVRAYYEDGSSKEVYSYSVSVINTTVVGAHSATIRYSENGITKSTIAIVNVTVLYKVCDKCGNAYPLDHNDIDWGCPICAQTVTRIEVDPIYIRVEQGMSLNITVKAIYKDGSNKVVSGWTSNYNPSILGMQIVTVEYGGYATEITVWVDEKSVVCPICSTRYPISDGRCPICSEHVESITVEPNSITVNQYDVIALTVIAHYSDGSSSAVTGWSIDRTSAEPGTYNATVSYRGAVTTITLTVIPLTAVHCPICGLIYEPTDHPGGCPVCSETITGIEAYLSSGSNRVQYGSTPSVIIILVFRDEHREIDTEGYSIENYNPYQIGAQTITVHYKEFQVNIDILVVNALASVICPKGHVYYLNEEGADPGCPYCNIAGQVGTVHYFDIVYVNEIVDTVYAEGMYIFIQGNYITVTVTRKNVSLFYNIQNTFFRTSMLGMKKIYIHGGGVY